MSKKGEHNGTPPPAYFLSVSLENVRCFGPKQTLDLSDGEGRPAQWIVILGDNGTGKTTLLQVIASVIPIPSSENPNFMGPHYAYTSLNTGFRRWKSNRFHFKCEIATEVELKSVDRNPKVVIVGVSNEGINTEGTLHKFENIGGLRCYAYGASRQMGEIGIARNGDVDVGEIETLFYDGVELPNPEEWLLQIDYATSRANASEKKKAKKRRSQVIEVLVQLLPDVDDIRFVEPEEGKLVPRVEFKTPYGWVRIGQLSLGYRTMIAWMVDVARRLFQRYPDSPDPLAEPAVVLVDEIDLHLHPRWQRDIIPFLSERFPNTQFIVTAHSPLVVQAAQDANIAVLRREGDHVVIEQDLKPLRNLRVDQILTSELYGLESARPPQLDELLEQRRTLLSKSSLTKKDRRRLKEIEEEIGDMPAGETPEEMEAMEIIRRAAERLKEDA